MANESVIKLFEGKQVRILWNEEEEKYYFSVADIIQVLTGTANITSYIKTMKNRDKELAKGWLQIVTPLPYETFGGKQKINFADLSGILRIIQSIPSKKAEPVKRWLAEVGAQRIDQMIDPEQTFQMAVEDYRHQGYSDKWINERMRSIEMRKELTDEWQRSGLPQRLISKAITVFSAASNTRRRRSAHVSFRWLPSTSVRCHSPLAARN